MAKSESAGDSRTIAQDDKQDETGEIVTVAPERGGAIHIPIGPTPIPSCGAFAGLPDARERYERRAWSEVEDEYDECNACFG